MWIFDTRIGFFSTVKDNQIEGNVLVRFRDPKHGAAFIKLAKARGEWPTASGKPPRTFKLKETPVADYRWKCSVPHAVYSAIVTELAEGIDYTNFKGRCSAKNSPRHIQDMHADQSRVWGVMNSHQRDVLNPPAPRPPAPARRFADDEFYQPRLFNRGTRFDEGDDSIEARAMGHE